MLVPRLEDYAPMSEDHWPASPSFKHVLSLASDNRWCEEDEKGGRTVMKMERRFSLTQIFTP